MDFCPGVHEIHSQGLRRYKDLSSDELHLFVFRFHCLFFPMDLPEDPRKGAILVFLPGLGEITQLMSDPGRRRKFAQLHVVRKNGLARTAVSSYWIRRIHITSNSD